MIDWIMIKNYKSIVSEIFKFGKNNLIIGTNDSGKTSILECIKIFFENSKIDTNFFNDKEKEINITIKIEDTVYSKVWKKDGKFNQNSWNQTGKELPSNLSLVHIGANNVDVISQFKAVLDSQIKNSQNEEIIAKINEIINNIFNEMVQSIDTEIISIPEINTEWNLKVSPEWNKAFKIEQKNTELTPIDGRGLGYQRNLLISLACSNLNSNIILLIDEIENSFSKKNVEKLIQILSRKTYQFICTTHNLNVLSACKKNKFSIKYKAIENVTEFDILEGLGLNKLQDSSKFIIMEGKTDIPYIESVLQILENGEEYIALYGGGQGNLVDFSLLLKKRLPFNCLNKIIYDGDQRNSKHSEHETIILEHNSIEYYNSKEDIISVLSTRFNEQEYKQQSIKFTKKDKQKLSEYFVKNEDSISKLSVFLKNKI